MLYPVKIEFKEYPSGSWQDWSEYLTEPPRISKKVESENEGEAGVIVFDDASVSFHYETGSPVYNTFSIDLTSKQRYLFKISALKTDQTYVQLFEGVADFSTLKWNEFNNVISFSLIDKLSALNLLKNTTLRGASKNLLYDRNTDPTVNNISINTGAADTENHHKWFNMYYKQDTLIKPTIDSNTPQLGEIIQSPFDTAALSIVKYKAKKVGDNLDTDPMYLDVLTTDTTYPKTSGNQKTVSNLFYYINEIYGVDLLVKQYRTNYKVYYKDAGNTIEIALQPGYEVVGYDALKLIEALIKSVWPEITIVKRPANLEFILPLDNFIRLVTEDLFGKEPLDALKMIADSMKCYIFIDRDGNFVIQSKSSLDTSGQTRSIGNTKIISGPDKKYFWDKLADGANIKALSWVKDDVTGEFLTGVAEITKQEVGFSLSGKIKPKNAIKKEIIVGDPAVNTQAELDSYAATEALSLLEFYGKRHSSFDLTLNLDDNTIDWELIDRLTINSLTTFISQLEFDLNERIVKLELVEITGHDYDFRQLVFGSAESSSSSYLFSSGASVGTSSSGFTPIFNLPLQMSGGIVSLLTTDNLKLTSDKLDTAQPIKTTDTPTFNQVNLSTAGTLTQAVRGDRSITTSYPLTGGGDLTADRTLGLSYNTTNLKLTSNALNTIQDIATTSSPTFAQLTLSNAGTTTTNAVRADRTINVSAPLTGGGNLTTDRTLGLSYNTTNLKLTSNALNTTQDIATTSSPTFATVKLTNLTDGYVPYHISDASGLNNSKIKFYSDISSSRNYLYGENVNIQLKDFTVLPSGYAASGLGLNFRFDANVLKFANRLPGVTVTSSGFNSSEIDTLFSVYASAVNLNGKPDDSYIEITGFSFSSSANSEWYPFFVMHTGGVPIDVIVKMEVKTSGDANWQLSWEGNIKNLPYYISTTPVVGGNLTGVRFTFSGQGSNNVYIRWLGVISKNNYAYMHTVKRDGDTMFGPLGFIGSNLYVGTVSDNDFEIKTNNATKIYIKSAGNVGIGTTSPTYKLDVSGTGRFTNELITDNIFKQLGSSGTNLFYTSIEQFGDDKSIGTNPFASGWTGSGWRIDKGITASGRTHLELDDLTVRGTMRVYELIINQIRATNGSLFVSSSAKVLSATLTTGDPETYTIVFEDPEGHNVTPFLVNDILLCQRVRLDSTTIVKQIVLQVTNIAGTTVTASVIYRNGTLDKNDLCVRIGNTTNTARQGSVYLTSDDSNAPYIDIVDGVNNWSAWSSSNKLKVRLGKLTGITDSFFGTLSGYGLYAKSNAYLRGKIYAEQGGWIAGWSITGNSLDSPIISSNHQLKLIADNTNSIIGTYLDVNTGGANPLYISLGRIKANSSTYSSNYGLSAKDEVGNDYFELSNTVKHIAGWNFDAQKLYNGTDIILNSSTKTISVNDDKVKMFYNNSGSWGLEGRDSSNNLIFQLGSTNKIAGWNFIPDHIYKLTSGTPTSSPSYGLTISSTATATVIIAYGSNYQRYVKLGYQTSGNWFGIEGTDTNANIIFQLGSTNKISGWNFDNNKLSNGIVSLEASTTMKGLVVDTDKVKIGEFTSTSITTNYSNINASILNGYSGINPSDTAWSIIGNYWIDNIAYTPGITVYNNYVNTYISNEVDSWSYRLTHRLFNHDTKVLGRRLRHKVKVHFTLGSELLAYSGGQFTIAIRYYNSGWATVYYQTLYAENIEDSLSETYTIDLSNGIEFELPAGIPNTATVYIEYTFNGGGQSGQYYPYDMNISDFYIEAYEEVKTHINQNGIYVYNAPNNYIKFNQSGFEINAAMLKSKNKPLIRFHGRLSSAPTQDIELGDMYIKTSDNKVYQCYNFDTSGVAQWTALN
ncbi:MAG: hypothetical protein HRF52_03880 [Ignavibacterium sp.]|jgi:hypothetical protein|uniref:hypothetical protein n=1 Tax=Ignavibacterium sp. TaxID=2651167 RepID=UPI00329682C1